MPHVLAHRPSLRGWRLAWRQWFALFALVFALPASEHVVRELVAVACEVAGDGCSDDCERGAGVCLNGCGHCACCQPPMAPSLGALLPTVAPSAVELRLAAPIEEPPLGVVASPFRPPIA